jgi:hypothetical protein
MASHGCFLKEKRSNDAIFRCDTPHVNLWLGPLIDNFLMWLTTPNSVVIFVHGTIQMVCCLIGKNIWKSHHCLFPAVFSHKVSAITVGWFDVLPQLQLVRT